ncbi:MAG: CFI-box-CTERM domain-containing protein [Halobacteriales archaeon]|nr:CFI-box-CTERM domain-containing protein [Halobacteriales archaeon]
MADDTDAGRDNELSATETDRFSATTDDETPIEVGDFREKHVRIVTDDGEEIDHSSVYFKHSATEFIVSQDPDFPPEDTERYSKDEVATAEITQHHSACFITTATTGSGSTLERLRIFRDEALSASPIGRGCIALYYAVSPPIAATLDRYPQSVPTRVVRWLVHRCGDLAARRGETRSSLRRAGFSTILVGLYMIGIVLAGVGHLGLRCREFLTV